MSILSISLIPRCTVASRVTLLGLLWRCLIILWEVVNAWLRLSIPRLHCRHLACRSPTPGLKAGSLGSRGRLWWYLRCCVSAVRRSCILGGIIALSPVRLCCRGACIIVVSGSGLSLTVNERVWRGFRGAPGSHIVWAHQRPSLRVQGIPRHSW